MPPVQAASVCCGDSATNYDVPHTICADVWVLRDLLGFLVIAEPCVLDGTAAVHVRFTLCLVGIRAGQGFLGAQRGDDVLTQQRETPAFV